MLLVIFIYNVCIHLKYSRCSYICPLNEFHSLKGTVYVVWIWWNVHGGSFLMHSVMWLPSFQVGIWIREMCYEFLYGKQFLYYSLWTMSILRILFKQGFVWNPEWIVILLPEVFKNWENYESIYILILYHFTADQVMYETRRVMRTSLNFHYCHTTKFMHELAMCTHLHRPTFLLFAIHCSNVYSQHLVSPLSYGHVSAP